MWFIHDLCNIKRRCHTHKESWHALMWTWHGSNRGPWGKAWPQSWIYPKTKEDQWWDHGIGPVLRPPRRRINEGENDVQADPMRPRSTMNWQDKTKMQLAVGNDAPPTISVWKWDENDTWRELDMEVTQPTRGYHIASDRLPLDPPISKHVAKITCATTMR